jgi:Bifunctional DNA primase/polymerase, N-terminal
MSGTFATEAPRYRERGFYPRPIELGSKACKIKGWQRPDSEVGEKDLARWLDQYGQQGIGLLMGSSLPDGTTLGALDVDRNEYVSLTKAMLGGNPPCGRFGSKGAVYFVRVGPGVKNKEFWVKGDTEKKWGKVVEALFFKSLCVIPPTVHPTTDEPYRWIGTPLLDIDLSTLPLIGA